MTIYPKNYYVYMYLREDGTPYYIGKGKHNRAWVNTGRTFRRPEDESRIVIHTEDLTEEQALSLEIELIAEYGRKDIGTGILRNLTDGGEGVTGLRHSEETKRKISDYRSGKENSKEARRKMSEAKRGKKFSQEHKRNLSKALKGREFSEETRNKMSQAHAKPCCDGDGVEYKSVRSAAEAHKISYAAALARCLRGSKGWSYI